MLVHPHMFHAQTEELESGARRDAHLVARGSVEALILSAPVRCIHSLPPPLLRTHTSESIRATQQHSTVHLQYEYC